jgi:hypothetical protein
VVIDLLVHRGEGDTPISELRRKNGGRVNLAEVMNEPAFGMHRACGGSQCYHKKDFLLELTAPPF